MSLELDELPLSAAELQRQRAAYRRLRAEMVVLLLLLLAGLVALILRPASVALGPGTGLGLLFGGLIGLLLVTGWRQWVLLYRYELRCPHCTARLAERVRIFPSPTPYCPACGRRAMASPAQLRRATPPN
jgi:hypothetical protein